MQNNISELDLLEILIKDLGFQKGVEDSHILQIAYHVEEKGFKAKCKYRGQSIYSDLMPTITGAAMSLWVELSEAKKNYLLMYSK